MAVAIAKFGWLLGAVVTVVLLALNVHVSMLLWRVRMRCPAKTYMELAHEAYAGAPPQLQRFMVLITGASQHLIILCFLSVYTLTFGKAFGMMFYSIHYCLPQWTLIGCMFVLPFVASARRLGEWQSLIWINCASILATVAVPLLVMANAGVEQTRRPGSAVLAIADLDVSGVTSGVSIMFFAFTSQFMIVEIMSEMRDLSEFPRAYIVWSAPFQAFAFLICGLGGYYYQGDKVTGMIVDSIPFGIYLQAAAILLLIHMIITFVIKGIVICREIQHAHSPQVVDDPSPRGWLYWVALVTAVMAFSYIVAQMVPFFVDLIDLIGAFISPIVNFILPILLYRRWLQDSGEHDDKPGYLEQAVIIFEAILALLLLFVGTYNASSNIVVKWRTYGYPFACHCEGLWNTCDCSAMHPGMEQCLT